MNCSLCCKVLDISTPNYHPTTLWSVYELANKQRPDGNLWPSNSVDTVSDRDLVSSEAIMDTVLFTDQGILLFVITTTAIALVLSVLGFATTDRTRSDIKHQLKGAAARRGSG